MQRAGWQVVRAKPLRHPPMGMAPAVNRSAFRDGRLLLVSTARAVGRNPEPKPASRAEETSACLERARLTGAWSENCSGAG